MIKLQRPITLSIVCTQLCSNLEKQNFPFVNCSICQNSLKTHAVSPSHFLVSISMMIPRLTTVHIIRLVFSLSSKRLE